MAGDGDGVRQVACGAPLAACSLSPVGDCVAAGGGDGRLHLWSFADGLQSEAVAGAAISSLTNVPGPGWHLAAGCEDGTIHVIGCSDES